MRIYLDCCCLNRPFDDRRQDRIRIEADAVASILLHIEHGDWQLIASHVLAVEVSRTPDPLRRRACLAVVAAASVIVPVSDEVRRETSRLVALGMKEMDAAHIASAATAGADVSLTVDDALLRIAHRIVHDIAIRVESPVAFLLGPRKGEAQ